MSRKAPSISATLVPEKTIKIGNDKMKWVVKKIENGTHRWIPYISAKLCGYMPLTVDYIAKHINKPIIIYEREYSDKWPTKSSKMFSLKFTPTGNAGIVGKKIIIGWLKNQTPIKDKTIFSIEGPLIYNKSKDIRNGLQVDSKNKILVSSNIMNMESFIKY